jgi:threonine synthase
VAASASDEAIRTATRHLATATGIDAAPEGGCALTVLRDQVAAGRIAGDAEVVLFNTGAGDSYRA